jgi:AcrR family transcriptional regulator
MNSQSWTIGGKMQQVLKTRKEIEEDTRREHILATAERLFAKQGLHDTSMADIAKESEFGVGTLYKYFKDKNTLIQLLLESRLEAHFDEIDDTLESTGTPAEIIARLIDCQMDSVAKRRLFFVIYFTHFHPGTIDGYSGYSGALDHVFMQNRKVKMLKAINAVFQRGIENKQFTNIDSRYLTAALFGMFISFSFLDEENTAEAWNLEEKKSALKKILFDRTLVQSTGTEN